jgi:hypothetical protein
VHDAAEIFIPSTTLIMNSGSEDTSTALPSTKSAAAVSPSSRHQHHPVRSPAPSNPDSSTARNSKSPSPGTVASAAAVPATNGDGSPRTSGANGHDESEAETDILSDSGRASIVKKHTVKLENGNDVGVLSPALTTRSEPARSNPTSRRSSINGDSSERREREKRGAVANKKENGSGEGNKSKSQHHKVRSMNSKADASSRAQSADASITPASEASDRQRQSLSVEPRKRKLSDEHRSKAEPPRQRPRLDSSAKSSSKTRITSPTTPATPGLSGQSGHKRSSSTQSGAAVAKPRKKRDISATSQPSEDKGKWADDSDSDSASVSSPRRTVPPVPLLEPPRSSRSSQRPLPSPARSTAAHSRRADKYGTTPLAKACERGSIEAVRKAYEQAPEELDQDDNGGFTPLQKAALSGHAVVVKFLLDKGCRRDCCSKDDRDTPLIDAVENSHMQVIKLLLDNGVNPHHANKNGNRAIDSVDYAGENAPEIERILKKAMAEYQVTENDQDEPTQESPVITRRDRGGTRPDLLYKELSVENLLKYSTSGDLEAVGLLIESVEPDNACAVAAARGGHDVVLNLLLASAQTKLEKDPDPTKHAETPMLAAIGRGHLKIIRLLLDQDNFNPTRKTREGKYYYQIAEERKGPRWQAESELLKERFDAFKARQQLKAAKKKRLLEGKGTIKSPPSRSTDPAPGSPRIAKAKVKQEKAEEERKVKRLSGSKELVPAREPPRRKRPVVEEDTSQDDLSDEAPKRRHPKSTRERAYSSVSEASQAAKAQEKMTAKTRAKRKSRDSASVKRESGDVPVAGDGDVEMKDVDDTSNPNTFDSGYAETAAAKPDVEKRESRARRSTEASESRKAAREAKELEEAESKAKRKAEEAEAKAKREAEEAAAAEKARQEAEARARAEAEAEAKAKAEAEAAAKAKEEAEAKARAEEEARIKAEAEQKAREEAERKRKEEEEAAERKRQQEREAMLSKLPLALRNAVTHGKDRPLAFQAAELPGGRPRFGIAMQFLPLFWTERRDIEPSNNSLESSTKFVLSFHAIGILGLEHIDVRKVFPDWTTIPATPEHLEAFSNCWDLSNLAQDEAWPQMGDKDYDYTLTMDALDNNKDKFLAMEQAWIPLDSLLAAIKEREWLSGLDITMTRCRAIMKNKSKRTFEELCGLATPPAEKKPRLSIGPDANPEGSIGTLEGDTSEVQEHENTEPSRQEENQKQDEQPDQPAEKPVLFDRSAPSAALPSEMVS